MLLQIRSGSRSLSPIISSICSYTKNWVWLGTGGRGTKYKLSVRG